MTGRRRRGRRDAARPHAVDREGAAGRQSRVLREALLPRGTTSREVPRRGPRPARRCSSALTGASPPTENLAGAAARCAARRHRPLQRRTDAARPLMRDPISGGGRIVGELCHFLDLACALAEGELAVSPPRRSRRRNPPNWPTRRRTGQLLLRLGGKPAIPGATATRSIPGRSDRGSYGGGVVGSSTISSPRDRVGRKAEPQPRTPPEKGHREEMRAPSSNPPPAA